MKNKLIYIFVILFSILFIFVGNKIATKKLTVFNNSGQEFLKVLITEITNKRTSTLNIEGLESPQATYIFFKAKILSGPKKDTIVEGYQDITSFAVSGAKEVSEGDKIILIKNNSDIKLNTSENLNSEDVQSLDSDASKNLQNAPEWIFAEYVRSDDLIILGIILIIGILFFGKLKGFNSIISIAFIILAIFLVYIPAILSGLNIYFWSIITCLFIILSTFIIVYGFNKQSLAASLGCLSGVFVSGSLTLIMSKIIQLSGYVDENSIYLLFLNEANPINLKAIIFGAIVIGALGAIMDVAIDISAALKELCANVENPTFNNIFKSGINIGKDIIGTMTNTLVLAYIGSSLSLVLLLVAYNNSLLYLFNREMIIVEILQAIVGSFGILFTIPLTSLIYAFLYTKRVKKEADYDIDKIKNM